MASDPSLGEGSQTDYLIQVRWSDSATWSPDSSKRTLKAATEERDWLAEHNPTAEFRIVVRKIVTTYSLL